MPKLRSLCGLLVMTTTAGCRNPDALVRKRAAQDFGCDPVSIIVEERAPLWLARGCGKQNAYSTTGEWGVTWAVPCDRGIDAGIPRPPRASGFDVAPAK